MGTCPLAVSVLGWAKALSNLAGVGQELPLLTRLQKTISGRRGREEWERREHASEHREEARVEYLPSSGLKKFLVAVPAT